MALAVIAFARDQTKLRDSVDRAHGALGRSITLLREKYGLPKTASIRIVQLHAEDPAAAPTGAVVASGVQSSAISARMTAGHQLFNDNCEHCVGPDAVAALKRAICGI
jgi:hypothetical protein